MRKPADAASFFDPGGALERAHPRFEHRPGQRIMAEAVAEVLHDGGVLMAEAGTGTGKTLAYLVPAVLSGERVVVSTGTRNLQDQIFHHDLPLLRNRVGLPVRACVMKGRENYLCRTRLATMLEQPLLEVADEAPYLDMIEAWADRTTTGDRAELGDLPDALRLWRDVNARGDTCTGKRCPEYDACWLTRLRRTAESSRIIVVNHHLFFADLAVRTPYGAVIPDYDRVIFDEAHLLEDVATRYFGIEVSSWQVEELARDAERRAAAAGGPRKGGGGAAGLRQAAQAFFEPLVERLQNVPGRIRFDPPHRGGPDLEASWRLLREALGGVQEAMAGLAEPGDDAEAVERRAAELASALDLLLERSDPAYVYGLEMRGKANVILSALPVDVAPLLRERLFERLHAAVLTSATLAVEGRFDFFQSRLGLDAARTLTVPSSFRHEEQAVLYLPPRMPEPRAPGFLDRAVEEIEALLEITRDRAFLLFTSYAMMERVREVLAARGHGPLWVQGEGSRPALLERFREQGGVLLGTASFWQGVDVPGEALSLVVIDKLPFDVPTDPLIAARIERIREAGGNPFETYQLPLAVLQLKQGLGRLLRSRTDRGILAVLDPRLSTRRYGATFLRSLPPYRVVRSLQACRRFFSGASAGTG